MPAPYAAKRIHPRKSAAVTIPANDCHTRAHHTNGKAETAQSIFKEDGEEKENREVPGKDDQLANLISRIGPAKALGERFFEHAKRGVDDEDSDGGSSAFREERQRNSLSVEIIHPATIASSSRLRHEVRLPDLQCLRTDALEQSRSLIHRRTWRVPSAAFNVTKSHF